LIAIYFDFRNNGVMFAYVSWRCCMKEREYYIHSDFLWNLADIFHEFPHYISKQQKHSL